MAVLRTASEEERSRENTGSGSEREWRKWRPLAGKGER